MHTTGGHRAIPSVIGGLVIGVPRGTGQNDLLTRLIFWLAVSRRRCPSDLMQTLADGEAAAGNACFVWRPDQVPRGRLVAMLWLGSWALARLGSCGWWRLCHCVTV
ncbi:hypothetical protein BS78_08G117100 [Paspalum vaginatum]|nr:hypothetical protein BS78_08G117100 [Paspalum vaginatum]KAJ1266001.1 hypothetical protein BS78_08G117100 [Paspalum vaginatum]